MSPLSSVTRWLLVVVGCAVLETAQPTNAAAAETVPVDAAPPSPSVEPATARTADTLLIPGGSSRPAASEAPAPRGNSSWLVVVGLCAGGAGIVWWRRRQERPAGKPGRQIQIEETRPLGNRQYLVVAAVGEKKFLLGVTPGSIQLLSPLEGASPTPRTE